MFKVMIALVMLFAAKSFAGVETLDWSLYDTTYTVKTPVIKSSETLINKVKPNFGTAYKTLVLDTTTALRIQSEDYNNGGKLVAFYDTTTGNSGGKYRTAVGDDVDIQVCSDTGGGYNVAWNGMNEWINYTITVNTPGIYVVKVRVANYLKPQGATFELLINGLNTRGKYAVPSTGGPQKWKICAIQDVFIPSGYNTITIRSALGGFSTNWIEIQKQ